MAKPTKQRIFRWCEHQDENDDTERKKRFWWDLNELCVCVQYWIVSIVTVALLLSLLHCTHFSWDGSSLPPISLTLSILLLFALNNCLVIMQISAQTKRESKIEWNTERRAKYFAEFSNCHTFNVRLHESRIISPILHRGYSDWLIFSDYVGSMIVRLSLSIVTIPYSFHQLPNSLRSVLFSGSLCKISLF